MADPNVFHRRVANQLQPPSTSSCWVFTRQRAHRYTPPHRCTQPRSSSSSRMWPVHHCNGCWSPGGGHDIAAGVLWPGRYAQGSSGCSPVLRCDKNQQPHCRPRSHRRGHASRRTSSQQPTHCRVLGARGASGSPARPVKLHFDFDCSTRVTPGGAFSPRNASFQLGCGGDQRGE